MLTTEQILDAAEDVLRKYGPRKTTVVDVARVLDVSHGTVYRHFDTKAALHEAITVRWLYRVTTPLAEISVGDESPVIRLRKWFETLIAIKLDIVANDPEMFESYSVIAKKAPKHIKTAHIEKLLNQVEAILQEGVNQELFDIEDCSVTARSLFFATVRFHHPMHAMEWQDEQIKTEFEQLYLLLEKAILRR